MARDGQLMAVDFREEDGEPVVGLPVVLFQTGDYRPATDNYAVSADGQRFLVKVPVDKDREQRIHVLLNWPSLLE